MLDEYWPPKETFEPFVFGQWRGIGFWKFAAYVSPHVLEQRKSIMVNKDINIHQSPEKMDLLKNLLE